MRRRRQERQEQAPGCRCTPAAPAGGARGRSALVLGRGYSGGSSGGRQRRTIFPATCDDDHRRVLPVRVPVVPVVPVLPVVRSAAAAPPPCLVVDSQRTLSPTESSSSTALPAAASPPLPTLLLNSPGQLCSAFFHGVAAVAPPTAAAADAAVVGEAAAAAEVFPEAVLCLDPKNCVRCPTTVLVVRVSFRQPAPGETAVFTARYHSCWRGYTKSVHAEEFMMGDARLTELLRAAPGPHRRPLCVDMFLTQQPCHYSSGRFATRKVSGKTSCTARMIEWWQCLQAREKKKEEEEEEEEEEEGEEEGKDILQIWVANVFRAHRIDEAAARLSEKERQVFVRRASNARRGLELLIAAGIGVRMINEEGWRFLGELAGLVEGGPGRCEPWEVLLEKRLELSKHADRFLVEKKNEHSSAAGGKCDLLFEQRERW